MCQRRNGGRERPQHAWQWQCADSGQIQGAVTCGCNLRHGAQSTQAQLGIPRLQQGQQPLPWEGKGVGAVSGHYSSLQDGIGGVAAEGNGRDHAMCPQ